MRPCFSLIVFLSAFAVCGAAEAFVKPEEMPKNEQEWKAKLTPEQYQVCRLKGTEAPFSGHFYKLDKNGMYACVACGNELFSSDTKFDSGTGWPSFWNVADKSRVRVVEDRSHGMVRDEVVCARCGSHLGHVFEDGPDPTGLRYCINSVSLDFKEQPAEK